MLDLLITGCEIGSNSSSILMHRLELLWFRQHCWSLLTNTAAAATFALAVTVLAGWHLGNATLVQVLPQFAPMQYNTAVAFALSAAALWACSRGRPVIAMTLAAVPGALSAATLAQYMTGRDFGIDQLLLEHHITTATSHPGRMAPNTALSFLLLAVALSLAAGASQRRKKPLIAASYLAAGVVILSFVAALGYLGGITTAYAWGDWTRMALHTSLGFIILGAGTLAYAMPSAGLGRSGQPLQTAIFLGVVTISFTALLAFGIQATDGNPFWPRVGLVFVIIIALLLAGAIYFLLSQLHRRYRLELENRQRRRDEQAAVSHASLLQSILSSISEGVIVCDPAGQVLGCNEAAKTLIHPDVAALPSHRWIEEYGCLDGPDGEPIVPSELPLARALRGERFDAAEIFIQSTGGGPGRLLGFSGSPLQDERGAAIGGVVTFRDVTASRLESGKLKKRVDRFQRAVEGAADGLWDWEIGSGQLWFAPRFAALLGYEPEELPNSFTTLETRLHPEDRDRTISALRRHLRQDAPYDMEFRLQTKSGLYRWFRGRGATLRDEAGKPLRTAGSIQDVHELKLAQQAIAERSRELLQVNQELEQFTYTVSHDLKSPLVTISGFLGMLERDLARGDLAAVALRIERIRSASDRMRQLLDELLALSRVGRVANPPEDVPLLEVAGEVLEMCAVGLHDRGMAILVADDLPVVRGDRLRLREVLQNLVENAIKFTAEQPHPRLEIGVRWESTSPGGQPILFVRDNGIGIEHEYRELVFNLFEQLCHDSPGTGIGLTLVKRIIEVHGGRIWIESAGAGQGTSVCFTLPAAAAAGAPPLSESSSLQGGLTGRPQECASVTV